MIKEHPTIAEAAKEFGVSPKTVREWIGKGLLEEPPSFDYGTRQVWIFPRNYMKEASRRLQEHRNGKKKRRK